MEALFGAVIDYGALHIVGDVTHSVDIDVLRHQIRQCATVLFIVASIDTDKAPIVELTLLAQIRNARVVLNALNLVQHSVFDKATHFIDDALLSVDAFESVCDTAPMQQPTETPSQKVRVQQNTAPFYAHRLEIVIRHGIVALFEER